MNTINRFICLIAVLFCLGMSSSVGAKTYAYTFGGEFDNDVDLEAPPPPFSIGDSFDGYLEYELNYPYGGGNNYGSFSLIEFSVSINGGEPITLDNFEPDVTSDQNDNFAYSAHIRAFVDADGSFSGGDLIGMYLSFNSADGHKHRPGEFNLGFGGPLHGFDYIGGRITRGTIIGFPASPPDLYTFSGVLDDADGTYPQFSSPAEFFGVVEFTVENVECRGLMGTEEPYVVDYPTVGSLSVLVDGWLINVPPARDPNFSEVSINSCAIVDGGPTTIPLLVSGTGQFEEFPLSQLLVELNEDVDSLFKIQFGENGNYVSGPVSGGTILDYSTFISAPSDDFVTTWQTDNPGTSNDTSITVPMVGGPYDVDWDNDGDFDEFGLYDSVTHDFLVAGTYTIRIKGAFSSIQFQWHPIGFVDDGKKIISLDQWGTHSWSSMSSAFAGASNLKFPATDIPDFSGVTNMSFMFGYATSANPNTNGWDTSAVINMSGMFDRAFAATPDTSGWDTSSVTNMAYMFSFAYSANPDTSAWVTSSVTNMRGMFYNAVSANPEVSGWDTSSLTSSGRMFRGATSFDRDIGSWNVLSLLEAEDMFAGVALSTSNYESLLTGWSSQPLQPGVIFSGGNSTYCSAKASGARANMMSTHGWVITDGGNSCPPGYSCNTNTISNTIDNFDPTIHEACETLVMGPDYIAADGSNIMANSGWKIDFLPGFLVEQGATLNVNVCGHSLCITSPGPMPYGCHSCVDQICDFDSSCCGLAWDEECLDMVSTKCGLVCE